MGGKKIKSKEAKDDKKKDDKKPEQEDVKKSRHVLAKLKHRAAKQKLDPLLEDQFQSGRLLACIASRPGQSGRADGYILEGEEIVLCNVCMNVFMYVCMYACMY